jgi:hypothetical protein
VRLAAAVTDDITVVYSRLAIPFPISHRDLVAIKAKKILDNGKHFIYGTAINNKSASTSHNETLVI